MKMHRTALLAGLFAATVGLAGCKGSQAPAPQETAADTALGPDAKPGVTAGGARLVLPVVPGRPGVAYFRVGNNAGAPLAIAAVHLQGVGRAEMHKTTGGKMTPVKQVDVAPGAAITFAPGGLHVMAFEIADTLKAGGETELTLTFADGDKISLPAKVEAMGTAGGMAH